MAKEELILLHIEEQAVVQVIIRDVAKYLDIQDNSKINAVRLYIVCTNSVGAGLSVQLATILFIILLWALPFSVKQLAHMAGQAAKTIDNQA